MIKSAKTRIITLTIILLIIVLGFSTLINVTNKGQQFSSAQESINKIENLKETTISTSDKHTCTYYLKSTNNFLHTYGYISLLLFLTIILITVIILSKGCLFKRKELLKKEKKLNLLQATNVQRVATHHFTLNILNSIGYLYENQEREKAQYYFGKYSKLLRYMLMNSKKSCVSIKEELTSIEYFLIIEKFKANNRFNFSIHAENIDETIIIPKYIIHTFVENAIKHGIFPILNERLTNINIYIKTDGNGVNIIIQDDGLGRTLAKKNQIESTGLGQKILDELLDLQKEINLIDTKYSIKDYDHSKEETGTIVNININTRKK